MTEAVPFINAMPEVGFSKFSIHALETAFRLSGLGKRSKQRFLKASSKDDSSIHEKVVGGNTVPYKCFILKQGAFPDETIELLRKGVLNIHFKFSKFISNLIVFKGLAKKETNPLGKWEYLKKTFTCMLSHCICISAAAELPLGSTAEQETVSNLPDNVINGAGELQVL